MDGGRHDQGSSGMDTSLGRHAKIQPSGKIPSFKRGMGEEGGTGVGGGGEGEARRRGGGGEGGIEATWGRGGGREGSRRRSVTASPASKQ